ncbi:MAG: O-antigen ligase family protein [Spirulina sp.]
MDYLSHINLKNWLDRFEKVFTVLSLFLYSAALLPVVLTGGASEGDGFDLSTADFTLNRLCFLLNYLTVTALLALRWRKTIQFLNGHYLFFALMALLPISYFWSAMPDQTIAASMRMIGTTFFGIYLASRFTLREQLRLICYMFGLSIVLSIFFIILLPKYGVMGGVHAGSMRGIYTHKNMFGKAMVLSVAAFLIYAKSARPGNWWPWVGVGSSFALVILSDSSSSLLNGIMLMSIVLSTQVIQLRGKDLIFSLLLLAAVIFALTQWFLPMAQAVVEALGKDMTLTGRTDIWPMSLAKIQERPWLGYGFNGFWHGLNGESLDMILAVRWRVPSSHNGFLDLWLDLGFVGFSLFFLLLWNSIIKIVFILRHQFNWVYVWPLALLVYTVIVNLTETALISQNSLGWVLFIAVTLSVNCDFERLTRGVDLWSSDSRWAIDS